MKYSIEICALSALKAMFTWAKPASLQNVVSSVELS